MWSGDNIVLYIPEKNCCKQWKIDKLTINIPYLLLSSYHRIQWGNYSNRWNGVEMHINIKE